MNYFHTVDMYTIPHIIPGIKWFNPRKKLLFKNYKKISLNLITDETKLRTRL